MSRMPVRPGEWLARQRRRITERLTRALVRQYRALTTYHFQDAVEFGRNAAPQVQGSQRSMADAVAEAFTEHARREFDRPGIQTPSVSDFRVTELRGVPTEQVYQRPFHEVWRELREREQQETLFLEEQRRADNLKEAIERGEQRLRAIIDEDLQLSYANAAREIINSLPAQVRPQWWRRVPRGQFTCAMCLIVSTRVYRTGELNPIHPACDCDVVPQFTPRPDFVIDRELVEKVHARVQKELGFVSRSGRPERPDQTDYRDLLFEVTEEHGELGEMLVRPRKRNRNRF